MTKRYMLSLAIATLGLGLALPAFAGVILNEIDYDQPSTDTAEWIELYNPDNVAQSLVDLDLVLVNGSNCLTYGTIGLDAITIPAQGYVVIGNIECATTLATLLASNAIQNGAPDDILIQDRNTLNILDSVEYEQPGASVCGADPTPATDDPAQYGSIQRCGNTWEYTTAPTPCGANSCSTPVEPTTWGLLKSLYK